MKISITTSMQRSPVRTVIYGEPGVGKTTFAASAPGCAFIDLDDSTSTIRAARISLSEGDGKDRRIAEYKDVIAALDLLIADPSKIGHVVIDTLDALEHLIHVHACRQANKANIEAFGYGKGYKIALDYLRHVLSRLEELGRRGVGTVLTAHAQVASFANPEGASWNYHDLKLHKEMAGLVVEWAHNVLFARRDQMALTEDGKTRGVGSGARIIHTVRTPTYVAKNRYDLPERLPLSWSDYAAAMDRRETRDPNALRREAADLAGQIGAPALDALAKIKDTQTLTRFIDHCKAKLDIKTESEK